MYYGLLYELNEQIAAIQPALAPMKKYRGGLLLKPRSLNETYVGSEKRPLKGTASNDVYFADDHAFAVSAVEKYVREVAAMLTPQQAKILYLRDQLGWSFKKCGKTLYPHANGAKCIAHKRYTSAKNMLKNWVQIRSLVDACDTKDGFDWDTLLAKSDFLSPLCRDILSCLVHAPDNFPSMRSLADFLSSYDSQIGQKCVYLRNALVCIGVPVEKLPPLLLRSKLKYQQQLKLGFCYRIFGKQK